MNRPLTRCPSCKRHIYSTESSCPFCARQTNTTPAILAAAFTAGLTIAGCGSEAPAAKAPIEVAVPPDSPAKPPQEVAEDPQPSPDPPPNVAPLYGAPPPVQAPISPPAAAYGAPSPMTPIPQRKP
ncbi:MAG TPA: hypothetical protein PK156_50170 [Polyangium sp.]|nr:hypothetical protein [Polyangium sp.]